jgi:hypothetical protein
VLGVIEGEILVRVVADHFVAGIVMEQLTHSRRCIAAAPILKWAIGCHDYDLRPIFKRNGWKASILG